MKLDDLARIRAEEVREWLFDTEPPPFGFVTARSVRSSSGGVWRKLAVVGVAALALIPLALFVGDGLGTGEPPNTTTPPGIAAPTFPPTTEAAPRPPFELEAFLRSRLAGTAHDTQIAVLVMLPDSADFPDLELVELEDTEQFPWFRVENAAQRFVEVNRTEPLEGEWRVYGLVPEFHESPVDEWVARLSEYPDVTAVVVSDFEAPHKAPPEGWEVVADLPITLAPATIIAPMGSGIVVIQENDTFRINSDGSITRGEPSPDYVPGQFIGGAPRAAWSDEILALWSGAVGAFTWILDGEALTWSDRIEQNPGQFHLGSTVLGDAIYVLALPSGQEPISAQLMSIGPTESWTQHPDPPVRISRGDLTTDGSSVYVVGRSVMRYTTGTGWDILPDVALNHLASSIVWVEGFGLYAWDYEMRFAHLSGDGWEYLDDVPLEFSECGPRSHALPGGFMADFCGQAAWFDAGSGTWQMPTHNFRLRPVVTDQGLYGFLTLSRGRTALIRYGRGRN